MRNGHPTRIEERNQDVNLVEYSLELGNQVLADRPREQRKALGQFLTSAVIARAMVRLLGPPDEEMRVLDPALGSGVLACAIVEQVILKGGKRVHIEGYELDKGLCGASQQALLHAQKVADEAGVTLSFTVHEEDFVLKHLPQGQLSLFTTSSQYEYSASTSYDVIIANPPYFKLSSDDPRAVAAQGQARGHTNIYTLFLSVAGERLSSRGKACFIVPRSFCSGAYFAPFRARFIEQHEPLQIHLFQARHDAFGADSVLQENIILTFQRRHHSRSYVAISSTASATSLKNEPLTRRVPTSLFTNDPQGTLFFRIPVGELDEQILAAVDSWPASLHHYGMKVSTGPVVAFRAAPFLTGAAMVETGHAAPLLWMQNVHPHRIEWPVTDGKKPQAILSKAEHLLVPAKHCVLLRRFSAKEEPRRLVAAAFSPRDHANKWIGLENHLNYIYRPRGEMTAAESHGLSALLNSAIVDRYFRILNGNTQVNATELRVLPLPSIDIVKQIGTRLLDRQTSDPCAINQTVFKILRDASLLPSGIPYFEETRSMGTKIFEAQQVLKELGLPPAQQNEIAALTLLTLAQLSEETPWKEGKRQSLRIHDILREIKERYGRSYAENTRETIRRQVIHQFEQAGLVERNPDEPTLPTNSPRTHYALSDVAIQALRRYEDSDWSDAVQGFRDRQGTLLELYRKRREHHKVPLQLADGSNVYLSPGKHNELQVSVIEEFGPRFLPGARLLYLGDTANKALILDEESLTKLGVALPSHEKLSDIVLYDEENNWLALIEVVTSHGPISPKRQLELSSIYRDCSANLIYVTVFPDFATFKTFAADIAWETEVWIAERPTHMIHYNGDRFFGPHA